MTSNQRDEVLRASARARRPEGAGGAEPQAPRPLVSVGVPVRNGAATLESALRSILDQSYPELEVIVSDNCSSDDTGTIVARYAAADPRVQYVRQATPVTAWRNFRFVLERARGEFFLWASHDDLRDLDYVERLLGALLATSTAGLAFGDLVPFSNPKARESAPVVEHDIAARARLPYYRRLGQLVRSPCAEMYGLFRTEVLRGYPFFDLDFSPDIPLLAYCTLRRDVVQVSGTRFYQHLPAVPKDANGRARANSFRRVHPFRLVRLCWVTAASVVLAEHERGIRRSREVAFLLLYAPLRTSVIKTWLFTMAPGPMRTAWRLVKYGQDPYSALGASEGLAASYGLAVRDGTAGDGPPPDGGDRDQPVRSLRHSQCWPLHPFRASRSPSNWKETQQVVPAEESSTTVEPSRFWRQLAAEHIDALDRYGLGEIKRRQALKYFTWQWRLGQLPGSEQFRFLLAHSSAAGLARAMVTPQPLAAGAWNGLPWSRVDRWLYAVATRLLWDYAEREGDGAALSLGEPALGNPPPVLHRGQPISQDLANSSLEIAAIKRALAGTAPQSIVEVGAGYGRTSYALLGVYPEARYMIIDIEPGLSLSRWYLSSLYPKRDLHFLRPDEATPERLGQVDLALSISSLQEMTREQVRDYLNLFDQVTDGVVYLKQWRRWVNPMDGITSDFEDYPVPPRWHVLFKEPAPVQTAFTQAAWRVARQPH